MGVDFFRGSIRWNSRTTPSWSYGGFAIFRRRLAEAEGFDLQAMKGFRDGGRSWSEVDTPLKPFLNHSDCDGTLGPANCVRVLPRLRSIISKWPLDDYDREMGFRLCKLMAKKTDKPLVFG